MENQNVTKSGWCKAAMICAIISLVIAVLPVLSVWFNLFVPVTWLTIPLAVLFGIIALVKKQNLKKTVIALVLAIVAWFLPAMILEGKAENAAKEATATLTDAAKNL